MIATQKTDIYISCPVCQDEGYNTQRTHWYHSSCGGKLQLTRKAQIHCGSCGQIDHISRWSFKCRNNRHDFKRASEDAYSLAISTASQMVNEAGNVWLRDVLENLSRY